MGDININLKILDKSNLPADDFIVLMLIYEERWAELSNFLEIRAITTEMTESYFKSYEEDGWLKIVGDCKNLSESLVVREKFTTLVSQNFKGEEYFNKIWDIFPEKAPTKYGGTRPLRAMGKDSQNYKEARKKFLIKVKTEAKAIDVLNRLKREVKERTESSSMTYMNNLITWINQSGWEKYEPLTENLNVGTGSIPGKEIY